MACKRVNFTEKIDFLTYYVNSGLLITIKPINYSLQVTVNLHTTSMYILSVNVIYNIFTDKIHTIYILWKIFTCAKS